MQPRLARDRAAAGQRPQHFPAAGSDLGQLHRGVPRLAIFSAGSVMAKSPSTARVRRHRENREAGMIWVPGFWLNEDETNLLAARGIVKDWNSEARNAKEVTALMRLTLLTALKT